MNILHITPDFNYSCGRSYYVFLLIKYLQRESHKVYLATNEGDSFDRINELDVPIFLVEGLNRKNPVSIARNIKAVKEIIASKKIDIVHSHHRIAELVANQSRNLITLSKTKTVHTALSIVGKRYLIEYKSDKIIAVSKTIKEILIRRFGVNNSNIEIIPNFSDTEEIRNGKNSIQIAGNNKHYYNILGIGRFVHDKNFETLLEAIHILNDPYIKLKLIGEGEKYFDFRSYIDRNKINVEIIPPQKNLNQYYNEADLCVLTSIRDPFPSFMLQSGLHRKPFIGSNVDGMKELIEDRRNGLLFKSGRSSELADKIKLLKNDKALADLCAQNLFSDVINNYTQLKIMPKVLALYMNLINE